MFLFTTIHSFFSLSSRSNDRNASIKDSNRCKWTEWTVWIGLIWLLDLEHLLQFARSVWQSSVGGCSGGWKMVVVCSLDTRSTNSLTEDTERVSETQMSKIRSTARNEELGRNEVETVTNQGKGEVLGASGSVKGNEPSKMCGCEARGRQGRKREREGRAGGREGGKPDSKGRRNLVSLSALFTDTDSLFPSSISPLSDKLHNFQRKSSYAKDGEAGNLLQGGREKKEWPQL